MVNSFAKHILRAALSVQEEARLLGFSPSNTASSDGLDRISIYANLITEKVLRETTRQLFVDGYYALAVEEAYKCLNNVVKSRSGLSADGADLMRKTFTPRNPILQLNELETDSQKNQQLGYMEIFAGCMTGIRNPRAHEHRYLDAVHTALEMLSWANHLLNIVNSAQRPSVLSDE